MIKDPLLYGRSHRPQVLLAVVAIAIIQALQFTVTPVLPQLGEHYADVSVSFIQMLVTIPQLTAMVFGLLSGWLVTRVSKKKLLISAAIVATASGLIPLAADSFALLFICRMVYGYACGTAIALNTAVVAEFYEGRERVRMMGLQAACVGCCIMIVTFLSGIAGRAGFRASYLMNLFGLVSLVMLAVFLPDTGRVDPESSAGLRPNRTVFILAGFMFLEWLFMTAFGTNIAMHLSGRLAGDPALAGTLSSISSLAMICMGLFLGSLTRRFGRFTLPLSMAFYGCAAVLFVLFPSAFLPLAAGAALVGASQGSFIPVMMTEASEIVEPAAVAMASAVLTAGSGIAQAVSPVVLNGVTGAVFGEVTTGRVFGVSAVSIFISAGLFVLWRVRAGARSGRI